PRQGAGAVGTRPGGGGRPAHRQPGAALLEPGRTGRAIPAFLAPVRAAGQAAGRAGGAGRRLRGAHAAAAYLAPDRAARPATAGAHAARALARPCGPRIVRADLLEAVRCVGTAPGRRGGPRQRPLYRAVARGVRALP